MLLVAVMAAAGLVSTGMSPAIADECDGAWVETPPGSGIVICVDTPSDPGGGDPGGGDPGGGGPATCYQEDASGDREEVPCSNESGGIWNSGNQCYAYPMDPQPPAGPIWGGHDPSEGSMWECGVLIGLPPSPPFFVANGAQPLVDPAVLAQRALDRMQLELADAQIAPGPEFHTYVRIDNWMWVPAGQWHDLSLTVSAGPTSVTATAEPVRVEWDMGAETVSCFDAGRAWKKGMTNAAKTTCDYAYESIENPTGDTHSVSAQIVYSVTWTCSGPCLSPAGDLGEVAAPSGETTTIEVRQRQTVVTN
jgi:hypothetical protein